MPYWPTLEGESKEVGRYVVTLLAEKDATDYKIRVMELTAPHRVRKESFQYLCANIHTNTFLCTAPVAQILSLYVILFHCISYHHHQQYEENSIVSLKCGFFVITKYSCIMVRSKGQKVRPLKVFSFRILKNVLICLNATYFVFLKNRQWENHN